MKFKFIHKIFVIQKRFLVSFNLLRGPDITRSGARSGPRAAGCASMAYTKIKFGVGWWASGWFGEPIELG